MTLHRQGRLRRGAAMIGSAVPSVTDLVRGMWNGERGRRWLIPLAVFLAATALLLVIAASVEALAPFIYAIF